MSRIADAATNDIAAWQDRPLEAVCPIVWTDGIVSKAREGPKVIDKTVHIAVGLPRDGKKEGSGPWSGKDGPAAF